MTLPATTYSAYRGYAWSNVPEGLTAERLATFCRAVSEARGDFPDPLSVEAGLITDCDLAAIYTLQNVANWDVEGRASDYFAFVFLPAKLMPLVDFVALISNDFFWTPTREPIKKLDYAEARSESCPENLPRELLTKRHATLTSPRQLGALVAKAVDGCNRLVCRLIEGTSVDITCRDLS